MLYIPANAQEMPARPMTVSALQPLNFGTFSPGTGGDVTIDAWGVRTVSSGIIKIGSDTYCPAIFEIDIEPGTMVRWVGCDVTLNGSSGGTLTISIPSSANSFVSTSRLYDAGDRIRVSIGGTLTIPAATLPGTYSNQFSITFYQE
jgi:hypothetical protein